MYGFKVLSIFVHLLSGIRGCVDLIACVKAVDPLRSLILQFLF